MKGSREHKNALSRHREHYKAIRYDSLYLFKLETCKKFRKTNRRARDGSHGTFAQQGYEL